MGVMAIGTAGTAQATVGACWGYINPTTKALECFSKTLEAKTAIGIETSATLLIVETNIEVLCTAAAFSEGGELSENGSILLGRVKFSGCKSNTSNAKLEKLGACTPNDPVGGLGTVVTEKGKGLIVLHNGTPVVQLEPDEGTILAKIFLGPECGVGGELIVEGKLILNPDCKGEFATHKEVHLIEEFTALQLMTVKKKKAFIDGSANVSLSGTHAGFLWGGHGA